MPHQKWLNRHGSICHEELWNDSAVTFKLPFCCGYWVHGLDHSGRIFRKLLYREESRRKDEWTLQEGRAASIHGKAAENGGL